MPEDDPDVPGVRLARRSPLAATAKLCPRCLTPLERGSRLGGWLLPQDYYCSKCGYTGTVFLEQTSDPIPQKEDGDGS